MKMAPRVVALALLTALAAGASQRQANADGPARKDDRMRYQKNPYANQPQTAWHGYGHRRDLGGLVHGVLGNVFRPYGYSNYDGDRGRRARGWRARGGRRRRPRKWWLRRARRRWLGRARRRRLRRAGRGWLGTDGDAWR